MKKSIFLTVALFAFTSITSQLLAQEAAKTSGYDLKKAVKCRVSQTESGCTLAFEYEVKAPRDVATGQSSGKRGYDYYQAQSSFSVSVSDNSVTEVKSPKDAASGQASGKRQHKPSPISSSETSSVQGSGGGSGKVNVQDISVSKVNVQDISFTKRCGGKTTKISCDGGDCEIPTGDCPNGDCAVTADWSWGMSQGGSSNRCSIDFFLKIEDGVCTDMAINEKGSLKTSFFIL